MVHTNHKIGFTKAYIKQFSSRCEEGLQLSLIEFVQDEEEEKVTIS